MMQKSINIAYTHAGTFHADDVLSSALLRIINPKIQIKRVFKAPTEIKDGEIVFDIGWGRFDHHQKDARVRQNGIKYAAFGLLWEELGGLFIDDQEGREMFDQWFVQPVDAQDNGQKPADDTVPVFTLSNAIGLFNPLWDGDETSDEQFEKAVALATTILEQSIASMRSKLRARDIVHEAVEKAEDRILILDRFVPWQDWIFKAGPKAEELLYVVFPSNRGGYNVQSIPVTPGSFNSRKMLPEEWRGKSAEELQALTKVATLSFVHNAGFLAAVGTLEDAINTAKLAIEA